MAGARAGRRARDRRVDARRRATDRTTVGYPSRAWAAHSACRDCDRPGCARVGGGRPRPRSHHGDVHDRPDLCLHRQTPARACLHARGRETARSRSRTRTAHATASAARSPPHQHAGDLSREDGRGGKHGHVGSVSRGLGAFGDPSAVLYRSPACCGKFPTIGYVRAVARIAPPTRGRNSVAAPRLGARQGEQQAGVWLGWPLSRC